MRVVYHLLSAFSSLLVANIAALKETDIWRQGAEEWESTVWKEIQVEEWEEWIKKGRADDFFIA